MKSYTVLRVAYIQVIKLGTSLSQNHICLGGFATVSDIDTSWELSVQLPRNPLIFCGKFCGNNIRT
jgi:hypothetical protein